MLSRYEEKKLRVRKPSRIWYRTYQKIQGISHTTFEFANEGDIKIHWLLRRLENTMNMLTDALPCITQWSMSKHGFPEPSTEHVVKDHCLRKRMELMQTILKLWILYDWNEFKKLASLNEHAAVQA